MFTDTDPAPVHGNGHEGRGWLRTAVVVAVALIMQYMASGFAWTQQRRIEAEQQIAVVEAQAAAAHAAGLRVAAGRHHVHERLVGVTLLVQGLRAWAEGRPHRLATAQVELPE